MQKLLTTTGMLCLLIGIPRGFAQDSQNVMKATVTGIGATADAAEKDALRKAVRQAVGAYIDSETLIRNEELIRDQVLEASGSYVRSYELIGKPKNNEFGLWEVEIHATVQGGQVTEKLKTINVIKSGVKTDDLYAEALTKLTNAKDGAEILKKQFPKELMHSLLVARLIWLAAVPP